MASTISNVIDSISSGTYFKETDLTTVVEEVGGFSAAALGLTEKGPAFEIVKSSSFPERKIKLGGLNPQYLTPYYARQFLEQSKNYREVRLLGLEGYSHTEGYAIAYAKGSRSKTNDTNNLNVFVGENCLYGVLKVRDKNLQNLGFAQNEFISKVEILNVSGDNTYLGNGTGILLDDTNIAEIQAASIEATDAAFRVRVTTAKPSNGEVIYSTIEVIASLRPDSKDYIVKKIWDTPFKKDTKGEKIYPLIEGKIFPLYVDYIIPSVKTKPNITLPKAYYLPGTTTLAPDNGFPLLTGNVGFRDSELTANINEVKNTYSINNIPYGLSTITKYNSNNPNASKLTFDYFDVDLDESLNKIQNGQIVELEYSKNTPESKAYGIVRFSDGAMSFINNAFWLDARLPSNPSQPNFIGYVSVGNLFYSGLSTSLQGQIDALISAVNNPNSGYAKVGFTAVQNGTNEVFIYAPEGLGANQNGLELSLLKYGNQLTGMLGLETENFDFGVTEVNNEDQLNTVLDKKRFMVSDLSDQIDDFFGNGELRRYQFNLKHISLDGTPGGYVNALGINDNNGNSVGVQRAATLKVYGPTAKTQNWKTQLLNLENTYTSPKTPWFVSDVDLNGNVKRLFRFQSISDGEAANTEIKVEVSNINPLANSGKGSFDILIRTFGDSDDISRSVVEFHSNLTMDKTSDNYILRKIGNGEDFPNQSKYIVLELNDQEILEDDLLPYGVEGFDVLDENTFSNFQWTTEYNVTKSIEKQMLGVTNNSLNTYAPLFPGQLRFFSDNKKTGKGFHLNPQGVTSNANLLNNFIVASPNNLKDTKGNDIFAPAEIKKRMKFTVGFCGGFDGWNILQERTFGVYGSKDYEALSIAVDLLSDNEILNSDFSVLVTPDFYFDKDSVANELVLEMVQKRGDCLYIPDLQYSTGDAQQAATNLESSNIKSSYSAVYHPWLQIEDNLNKLNLWTPPSILALGTIAYVATSQDIFQPPGGTLKTTTNNLVQSRKRMRHKDREILKAASINPITHFAGSGYEITEVRTTQEFFSALSFIHNRLLLCYAKKTLSQVLRPLLLQLNNELNVDEFRNIVTPIFDRIKKANGVEDFSVEIADNKGLKDRTTLRGKIKIIPLYPIEKIEVEFSLEDNAFSFNELSN